MWRSIAADNPKFVVGRRRGDRLVIAVAESSPASVRATLDDLLACLAAAERSASAARAPNAK